MWGSWLKFSHFLHEIPVLQTYCRLGRRRRMEVSKAGLCKENMLNKQSLHCKA